MTTIIRRLAVALLIGFAAGTANADDVAIPVDETEKRRWTQRELWKGYVVFDHHPLDVLPPSHVPTRPVTTRNLSCTLAQGEHESLQLGVHAIRGVLEDVRLEVDCELTVDIYHQGKVPDHGYPAHVLLDRGQTVEKIDQGTSAGFWLTFYASSDTRAGVHRGTITIKPAGRPATQLELQMRVRPFVLPLPRIAFGMYFGLQYLPEHCQTDRAKAKIYRDMAAHAHTSVTWWSNGDWSQLPPRNSNMLNSLPMAMEAGLTRPEIPCLVMGEPARGRTAQDVMANVSWLRAECQRQGWPEILRYGVDEPGYPDPRVIPNLRHWRDVPMRIETAMGAQAAYGYSDVHDAWAVAAGSITAEMSAEATRLGAEVWTYSHRILGSHPLRNRYFAGLYTWAYALKGNWIWCYSDVATGGYNAFVWWHDYDDEPQPMVGWENRREGIDDYRYLQLLEETVAARAEDALAVEAGAWLETLRPIASTDPHMAEAGRPLAQVDYDHIRARAAEYIEKLGPAKRPERFAAETPLRAWKGLKDEARIFRGKPLNDCIAGLASRDTSVRRAAAWALCEMGAAAAPATRALANLLADPEIRMPAIRALEAIGPASYIAAPKLAALLRHHDGYVRLGATYALGALASTDRNFRIVGQDPAPHSRAAVEPLRLALTDEFGPVAQVAGQQLARFGRYAVPALPQAIKLLDDPRDSYRLAGLKIIAAMGAEAKEAVSKIVKLYEKEKGQAPYEALTLAAIVPAASEAIPVLTRYVTPDSHYLADAYYALFCIRGQTSDLEEMINLLERTDLARPKQQEYVIEFLNALGVEGALGADRVRALLKKDVPRKAGLQAYLRKVEKAEGPFVLLP